MGVVALLVAPSQPLYFVTRLRTYIPGHFAAVFDGVPVELALDSQVRRSLQFGIAILLPANPPIVTITSWNKASLLAIALSTASFFNLCCRSHARLRLASTFSSLVSSAGAIFGAANCA